MPRAIILAVITSISGFCIHSSQAADFWEKKSYLEWSDKEVKKMLNDSPWSKKAYLPGRADQSPGVAGPDATMSGGRSRGATGMPGTGAPSGEGGEASVRRAGGSGGRFPSGPAGMELLVRWASSLPVKQAMIRQRFGNQAASSPEVGQLLGREESDYMLTVHNLPRRLSSMDPAQLKAALLKLARLKIKDRDNLPPNDVHIAPTDDGGIVAAFVFPKNKPITLEDKEAEFGIQLGPAEFKCKFVLRDMVVEGKLQL